jgi:hypothetical protein
VLVIRGVVNARNEAMVSLRVRGPGGSELVVVGRETRAMAFDQISLFVYPARWERRSVATSSMNYKGEPVRVVSAVRVEEADASAVPVEDLRQWLTSRGFEVVVDAPEYVQFDTAAVPSAFGPQAEIEIGAGVSGGEVVSLYCRFLLTRDAPLRLERWKALFEELCGEFRLRIGVADGELAGPEEFLTIVRGMDNWRYFADRFGWARPEDEPA